MSKKQKRWRISDIMDAIVKEHQARGADLGEHEYDATKSCPSCATAARDFALRHRDARPLDVIHGRSVQFAAALAEWRTSVEVADALVAAAKRLNVPMNG